jgi:hypothetical protein
MDGGAERRRREFIRAHHPDRGGDPEVFMAGLRQFDTAPEQPGPEPLPRVVVIVHRGWLIRLITALTQWMHPEERVPRVR